MTRSDAKPVALVLTIGCLAAITSAAAQAKVTFFSNEAAFTAAEPGASPVSFASLIGPLQPYVLADGLPLPGATVSTKGKGTPSSGLIVFRNSIGNNWFENRVVLSFAPDLNAVGVNVFSELGEVGASPIIAPITENVFSGSKLIGSRTQGKASGYFFGASSAIPITEVTLFSNCNQDCSTFVSSISLNPVALGATLTPSVPEPDSWALVLAGFGGLGLWRLAGNRRASLPEG
jgi:MYXO-CTERM domain-containing protein